MVPEREDLGRGFELARPGENVEEAGPPVESTHVVGGLAELEVGPWRHLFGQVPAQLPPLD